MSWIGRARRVRPIQQMEAAECGIACLAMVLETHGCALPLRSLRKSCGTSRDGNSAKQLLLAARSHGLQANGVRAEPDALRKLALPAILHWELNHFVVLERVHSRGHLTLVDPATGRIKVPPSTVDRCFSGIALQMQPGPALKIQARQFPGLRRYFSELRNCRTISLYVLLAGICGQMVSVVAPAASQLLIDQVIRPARQQWLLPIMAVILAAGIVEVVLQFAHQRALLTLQEKLGLSFTRRLGNHLLRLPLHFVDSRSRGDLLDRVESQGELGELVSRTVFGAFDLFFVAMLTALMIAYHPVLAALTLGIDAFRIGLVRLLREACRQRTAGEVAARGRERSVTLEATSQRELIRAFGIETGMNQRYLKRLNERLRWSVQSEKLTTAASRWLSGFDATSRALILWQGGSAVILGSMTLGQFAGFLAIRAIMSAPLGGLVSTVESWLLFQSTLIRADDLLQEDAPVVGSQKLSKPLRGHLQLQNISFQYGNGGTWILKNVSLTLEPGQNVVLVGASGEGKSTLLKIACGVLQPTSGSVRLDGIPISQFAPEVLRRNLGAVVGTPLLVPGSVRQNILLRNPEASEQQFKHAIEASCCTEILHQLPGGSNEQLEARGANLSGGERQRLGLAQAFLGQPPLLFLDEATCFLDAPLEKAILHNIRGWQSTVLSVAHRAPAINAADIVLEVRNGTVTLGAPPLPSRRRRLPAREEKNFRPT